ncbi:MAG: APC family permease [Candidatus Bathyarchaeia archaeon]
MTKVSENKELCPKPPPQFVRDATGLVRSFNWFDAFMMSAAVTGASYYGYASQIGFVAPADPGADFTISALIGFIFTIPLGVLYYIFSVRVPRSGGDYVWISRSSHPTIGFMSGWAMWLSFLALLSGGASAFGAVVLPVYFATLGYAWNIPSLISLATSFASPTNIFLGAVSLVVLGMLINSLGPRFWSRVMIILTIIINVGTYLSFILFATTSNQSFVNAFNSYPPNLANNVTYTGIITQAQTAGWAYQPVTTFLTILSIPFGVLLFSGFNFATVAGGEIRKTKQSMFWGTLFALVYSAVIELIGLSLSINTIGYKFNQAAFALAGSGTWPLAAPPWVGLLLPMVVSNSVVLFFLQLGWLLFDIWWISALLLVCSRYVFAFSFDRLLPSAFASVNDRLRLPLNAMIVNFVGAIIFIYITSFTTFIGTFLNTTTIWSVVWAILGIVAVALPHWKRELAEQMIGSKLRVPLISIVGFFTIVMAVVTFYFSVTTAAIGPSTIQSDLVLVGVFLSGAIIFLISYLYHKREGIDIRMIGREIPPE